jgi:hypothetical protein
VAIELTSLRQSVVTWQLAVRVLALDEMNHEGVILEADSYRFSVRAGQTVGMTLDIGRPIFDEPGGCWVRLLANDKPLAFCDFAVCRISRTAEI